MSEWVNKLRQLKQKSGVITRFLGRQNATEQEPARQNREISRCELVKLFPEKLEPLKVGPGNDRDITRRVREALYG